jgi:hypothetical protein
MFDCGFNLRSWAAVAALAAGNVFCSAQPGPSSGSALFSKPSDGAITIPESNDNVPVDNSSGRVLRGLNSVAPPLPSPTPDFNPDLQKQMDQRAKWTLMTPEEIMGIQTPEEIFGVDTEDQNRNLSPEERYLRREEKARASAANDEMRDIGNSSHNYVGLFDRADNQNPQLSGQDGAGPGAFSRMFNNSEASPFSRNGGSSGFAKVASVSAADKAKADKDQAAEMARFRSLIGEVPEMPNPALNQPHLDATPGPQPLSVFEEFGRPATIHTVDLSKPEGLTLPPEIVGYAAQPRKLKKPSWEPQAPPWLTEGVNPPTTPPVRKFY